RSPGEDGSFGDHVRHAEPPALPEQRLRQCLLRLEPERDAGELRRPGPRDRQADLPRGLDDRRQRPALVRLALAGTPVLHREPRFALADAPRSARVVLTSDCINTKGPLARAALFFGRRALGAGRGAGGAWDAQHVFSRDVQRLAPSAARRAYG